MSDNETPTQYLTMTLRIHTINPDTGQRTYLPVSEPNVRNAAFDSPCSCPNCREQSATTLEPATVTR